MLTIIILMLIENITIQKRDNKYFIRYYHSNKMDIVPLKLKIKIFYYEIQDYNNGNNTIYIENSDKGFFETMRENGIRLLN